MTFSKTPSAFIPRSPSSKRHLQTCGRTQLSPRAAWLILVPKRYFLDLGTCLQLQTFPCTVGKQLPYALDRAESCTEVRPLPEEWEVSLFSSYPEITFTTRQMLRGKQRVQSLQCKYCQYRFKDGYRNNKVCYRTLN